MAPPAQSHRSPSPSQPSGKGEVSDLKMQLRQLAGSRAPGTDDSKRELFKKVISYMTIGIDVSSLFSEMVMCSATSDIVLKKMCYLYVGNYAKCNPDLSLLTINFLQRDCKDEDPMIRGLALRSLCSLRVANLVEYLVGPLGLGLKDGNSYVRTVAAIGVLKLYHISAATCIDADFPAMLKHLMLNDPDTQVVANSLSALQEIWSLEASQSEEASREREALLSKPMVYYFLNRIKEFTEWAQCLVLELVSKYVPADTNEIFDMMNLLEDRLQHANGAVVLATIKLFLQLTLSMTDVHQQVYERIKAPLLTLVSSGSPEQSYAVLGHLHLLVMRAPMLFSSDYKHFYCQYNDPFYVKKLKLDMLTAVANESNTYEIVTELCEYAANVDIPIARESIRAVGKIALQQYDVNAIVDRLLQFLEMEKDYVTAETLVLVKDLLRKYLQWSHDCIAVVGNISSKNVQEPKAKAALIWMLGEYCQDMQDAPYVLESLIDSWDDEHSAEEASLVRLTMNALQGIESALITIENLCAAFCSDPADRTFHRIPSLWKRSSSTLALGKILKSIGRSGCVVFILHKFVDHFKNFNFDESLSCSKLMNSEAEENHNDRKGEGGEHHPYSLVNQAFSVAVQKVLEGYICTLDTLFASVGLRRSSKTVEVTLLEVYLHTKELRSQIEAIGNICNIHNIALCFSVSSFEGLIAKANLEFHKFPRGGDLLTYLYTQLRVADPAHTALLKFLFLCSCEPYCEFIRSWIYKAKISDPYKEFVMEYVENTPYPPGKAGSFSDIRLATIRERDGVAVPCFLKDFSIPLVRAGQQLQVLMKLLELCSHIGTVNHTYEDILPCWSGFSSDHPYYASPLTFNQGSIEAMVLARNDYYKRMLEKLDTILTKLEIRYQQVVADDSVPVFVNNNGGNLNNPISFMKDGSFIFPSTDKTDLDVAFNTMESEASSTTDEFSYVEDQLESSECSSLNGSEEKNESVQLIQLPNSLVVFEQNYLSALNLLSRTSIHNLSQKPSESDTSNHIEADSCEIYERTDLDDHSVHPCRRETNLSENPVCLDSGKPNWSWLSETQYTESQFDTGLLFSGLVKNPFFVDRRPRHDTRSHPSEHGLKASTRNTGVLKEGAPYLSNMILTENSLAEETNDNGQLPNRTCASSSSFTLQPLKLNYHSNLLSMNPLLSKNELISRRGERWCRDRTEPFPCFDFSSVKDPYKVYVENLVPSPRCQFEADPMIFKNSNASAATCKSNHHNKEGYDGHEILIDKTEFAHVNLTLESKNDKKEDVILENVSGGSGWQSMLSCSDNAHNFSSRDHRNSLAAIFEMPLDFVIEKCLLQEILLQYRYVSKLTIKLLEEGFDLQEHLLALRRYHFMELADWADLFIMSLWHHKWYVTEAERKVSEIQGLLEMSVQRSSCERDHYKDRLFVYMKGNGNGMMPLSTSTIGVDSFDFLGLGYRVDWPVSIVLTPGALKIYAQIFSFLIRVKLAVFSLTDVWCSLKDLLHFVNENRHSEVHEPEMRHFNILMRVRHQVNHFVSTLQQYVQSQLSHVSWCRFLDCLKHKVKDMMDLKSVHMAYLTDSLHICFLSDELQSIASIIENILQCALEFRACLIGSMYDAGLDGNFSDKLSRINISQVLAIKRTFDKNLKELHLCYLKTPKHREFALSHFWSYLNFNEYYSDVSNETSHYAFSV